MVTDVSSVCAVENCPAQNQTPSCDRPRVTAWRVVQYLCLVAGIILVGLLLFKPALGLGLLWNGLIPVAPALIVVAPGLWRNICPMATFSLLPQQWGISRQVQVRQEIAPVLGALGLAALLLVIPLRHLVLNTDGPATALMLILSAAIAFALGIAFDWRSGWCNGACPIHPAEKLYGQSPAITVANARCDSCYQCSTPCPDSTRSMQPLVTRPSQLARMTGHIMVGGFVGFIWGWYRTPDYIGAVSVTDVVAAYAWPFGMGLLTLATYGIAYRWIFHSASGRRRLIRQFATAAVCTYYWFRVPMLAGFGSHAGSGVLLDMTTTMPALPWFSRVITTTLFIWFMLIRQDSGKAWAFRPARAGTCRN